MEMELSSYWVFKKWCNLEQLQNLYYVKSFTKRLFEWCLHLLEYHFTFSISIYPFSFKFSIVLFVMWHQPIIYLLSELHLFRLNASRYWRPFC